MKRPGRGQPIKPLSLRLKVEGRTLRDDMGRQVLLRGVNAGGRSKTPPFVPFPYRESGFPGQDAAPGFFASATHFFAPLARWGHNFARLPFTWEAVEPQRGLYNIAFVHVFAGMIRACHARGIRVVVDLHQDIFSRHYGGDGFPRWALPSPPGEPSRDGAHWFESYFTNEHVQRAFDRFWADEDGLQQSFIDMWRYVARHLWPIDAVIGFEIMNEPGWGSASWRDWAKNTLTPFYARVAAAIREVAPEALIFFDPTGADALSGKTEVGRPEGEAMVFAPHYYDRTVFTEKRWTRETDYVAALGNWERVADGFGTPVLLGELGVPRAVEGARECLRQQLDALDRHLMHGAVWHYSVGREDWNDEGMNLLDPFGDETPMVAEVVRPYPRAIAGTAIGFRYDAEKRTGILQWNAEPGVTELCAPTQVYPEGPRTFLDGVNGHTEWDPARGVVMVITKEAGRASLELEPSEVVE